MPFKPLQTISRDDTARLRGGICPNCNGTHFLANKDTWQTWWTTEGAYRRILCIKCLREFGVAPSHRVGSEWVDEPKAIIIYYLMPARKLAQVYHIHSGSFADPALPEATAVPAIPEV